MGRLGWTLIAIFLVFLAALYVVLPSTTQVFGKSVAINKGIDLAGGVRVLLCAPNNAQVTDADMNTARDVIANRAAGGIGVVEPAVSRVGSKCISAEMPGLKNQKAVIDSIGRTGYLALTDSGAQSLGAGVRVTLSCKTAGCAPGAKVGPTNLSARPHPILQVVVPGKEVKQGSAQVGFDQSGNPTVTYSLKGTGSNDWCTFTTNNVKRFSAIVLDNKIVSDPQIQDAICGGQTQITGLASTQEAQNIATFLNYGALPVPLHVDSSEAVAATLGPEYVNQALKAGVIGLIIVALFMLLYYRLPGLLADVALVMYAALVFALFKLIGVTMTLAGIAGFILSIGMAVDANVLIFERMREELRGGKTLGAAVEAGFRRAFPSIRDSNASTLITTVILFWFGHNFAATVITGFATTLFIGVVVSFITAVFVTHTFLRVIVHMGWMRNNLALYGAEPARGEQVA